MGVPGPSRRPLGAFSQAIGTVTSWQTVRIKLGLELSPCTLGTLDLTNFLFPACSASEGEEMYTLEPGMAVQDSRGRNLGTIARLRPCCLEPSAGPALNMDALIAVDDWGALVCDVDHRRLFQCPIHGNVKAEK